MNNIEISESNVFEKIIIDGGELTLKRLQDTFPGLRIFAWRTFEIGMNAGGVASVAFALDKEAFKRFRQIVESERGRFGELINDGLLWDGVDNHVWTLSYGHTSDIIDVLKQTLKERNEQ